MAIKMAQDHYRARGDAWHGSGSTSSAKRRYHRKSSNSSTVVKTTVGKLNLDHVKPQRAGVIPYTVYKGATYFGLGLDADSHDLTDFAGSVKYRSDRDVVTGAMREFHEETLNIFEYLPKECISICPTIYDENNLIIFIHLSIHPDEVCEVFNRRHAEIMATAAIHSSPDRNSSTPKWSRRKIPEVCGITWLSLEDFQFTIKQPGILFNRVQRFLQRAGDFSFLL